MDVGLHGWGVHPKVHFTRRALYFNSIFIFSFSK